MDIDTELIQSKDIVFPSYSETVMVAQRAKQIKTKQNKILTRIPDGRIKDRTYTTYHLFNLKLISRASSTFLLNSRVVLVIWLR